MPLSETEFSALVQLMDAKVNLEAAREAVHRDSNNADALVAAVRSHDQVSAAVKVTVTGVV